MTGGTGTERAELSPYVDFDRAQWSALRASTPLTLTESDVEALRGLNEPFELSEVEDVYLPLTRLLNLRFAATRDLRVVTETFLGHLHARVPYVIGIGGSVAAGKSTIARLLQALLGRWPDHPRVDLVTTDGFLYPNAVLEARGLMSRKGFPESYDVRALLAFLAALKAGEPEVRAPVYSHLTYDIVDGDENVLRSPDIVIVEGVNVLQTPARRGRTDASLVVSDFFDFSIYVDASEEDLEDWYVTRLLLLRETSLHDPALVLQLPHPLVGGRDAALRLGGLARDQPREPAREHRAEPGARAPRAREGRRSPRAARAAPQALSRRRSDRTSRSVSSARTPRRPNHANSAIHAASSSPSTSGPGSVSARRPTDSRHADERVREHAALVVGGREVDERRDRVGGGLQDRRRPCARTRGRCGSTRRTAGGTTSGRRPRTGSTRGSRPRPARGPTWRGSVASASRSRSRRPVSSSSSP